MSEKLNILALEPYYGGSHKIFLDRIVSDSTHSWEIITLPPWKWKWRMMHSALTFAEQLEKNETGNLKLETGEETKDSTSNIHHPISNKLEQPDIIFVTDMLNLAEFKGLAPAKFADIPTVAYFHENQLTYPTHYEKKKDRYFGWINITTALAADSVWFNSEYHMNSFIDEVIARIKKAPDCRPVHTSDLIRAKSIIIPQGIKKFQDPKSGICGPGNNISPLRILWAARWEFDKNPGDFFDALRIIKAKGIEFRLSVLGGNPKDKNPIFIKAKKEFEYHIDHWGFLESQEEYEKVLMDSDVAVSTAIHEFFGISIAEAVSAGAFPLVPRRLAYPEVLKENKDDSGKESFFYDGSPANLAEKIANLAKLKEAGSLWEGDDQRGVRKVSRFYWDNLIPELDKQLKKLTTK